MIRTLRIFAIIALLSLAFFLILARLPYQPAYGDSELALLPVLIPGIFANLVGQTTFALCLGVGVAALVASIQRRQHGWAVGLVALLLVAANGSLLAVELAPLFDNMQFLASAPYVRLLSDALVPLAVLIYTFSSHPRVTQPIQPSSVLE